MAEIKWIKITTDMFDNRKIKHLRKLPDGNNIVLIWVMLLTMAGRCNSSGMIFLTENIPYTPKMLADELDFEESTVVLALQALEQFNMIVTNNGYFSIAGWDEYQNVDGMDKIREQNRVRVAKHREKRKMLGCNVTSNVTVTQCNAIDIDKDIDKSKKEKKHIGERFFPDDALNDAFKDYIEFRRKIKKPMTDKAIELAITKVAKLSNGDELKAIEILNQSIEQGWSGLYELRTEQQRNGVDWDSV